jgi:hypothetical protein
MPMQVADLSTPPTSLCCQAKPQNLWPSSNLVWDVFFLRAIYLAVEEHAKFILAS